MPSQKWDHHPGIPCMLLAAASIVAAMLLPLACDTPTGSSLLPQVGGMTDESDLLGNGSDTGGSGGGANAGDSGAGAAGPDGSGDAGSSGGADDTNSNAPGGGSPGGSPGGDGSSNGVDPQPPPPPAPLMPPAPRRSVFTYTPDGGYRISGGPVPNPYYQSRLMTVIPKYAAYGFGRYVSMTYQGNARSLADATNYYNPIVDVAEAHDVHFVPGFWMADIFANVYGPEDQPPWNAAYGAEHHPKIPSGLTDPAWWAEFITRAEILAKGARSTQVFVEAEAVFWLQQDNPYWTESNLAAIRPLARQAVADLRARGVTLIMYHPWPLATVDITERMSEVIFGPDDPNDPNDPMNSVEHFTPAPYFRIANYALPEPADVIAYYTSHRMSGEHVRFGFMSNHAGAHCFTPQQYHDWCVARPGAEEKTWYFCGTSLFEINADEFLNIANSAGGSGNDGGGTGGGGVSGTPL